LSFIFGMFRLLYVRVLDVCCCLSRSVGECLVDQLSFISRILYRGSVVCTTFEFHSAFVFCMSYNVTYQLL
jgi:hypothetical protein